VDISEEDPSWLKAKGDDFFRGGDYRSAVNAYSSAIEADETMISCYSNRSACFLKLGVPIDCRSDCSEGIELIMKYLGSTAVDEDEALQLKKTMAKLLMRRGISNCQLGSYADASRDYASGIEALLATGGTETAIASARSDMEKLTALQTADTYKKKGDEVMAEGNIAQAIMFYTQALQASPVHVGCLSNRAAGKLATHDYEGCIADCSAALNILDEDERGSSGAGKIMSGAGADSLSMMTAVLPPKGSDKRKSWVLKTLVRRGAAYAQNKDIDAAIVDYGKACALEPTNTALKEDLNKMTNYRAGLRAEASKLQ
jgi:dyslexia susceptibility 1 candidate gene 1 protein